MGLMNSLTVNTVRNAIFPRSVREQVAALAGKPEQIARRRITRYPKSAVKKAFAKDRWLCNYMLNLWECETGADVLETYPWNIALPIADICNARCTFCNSWLAGTAVLKPEQLTPFLEVLPYARLIGIQGHGEPLANPHIETILDHISRVVDPRANGYIITNGIFLGKYLDKLLNSCIETYNISLNAVTEQTHDVVMGLGRNKIDSILDTIRKLVDFRDASRPDMKITISMVLTADNIHEAAAFVELGNALRVTRVYLRTLMPHSGDQVASGGLNYHLLSPNLAPEFAFHMEQALNAIEKSSIPVETQPDTWSTDALSPKLRSLADEGKIPFVRREDAVKNRDLRPRHAANHAEKAGSGRQITYVDDLKFNPYDRSSPFNCRFVYQKLITTKLSLEMHPCCYMTDIPGYEPVVLNSDRPFMEQWNNPAFVHLRQRLRTGPLYQACATCPMQG
jgi:pyruvate-formate lyase-activating enzyme